MVCVQCTVYGVQYMVCVQSMVCVQYMVCTVFGVYGVYSIWYIWTVQYGVYGLYGVYGVYGVYSIWCVYSVQYVWQENHQILGHLWFWPALHATLTSANWLCRTSLWPLLCSTLL